MSEPHIQYAAGIDMGSVYTHVIAGCSEGNRPTFKEGALFIPGLIDARRVQANSRLQQEPIDQIIDLLDHYRKLMPNWLGVSIIASPEAESGCRTLHDAIATRLKMRVSSIVSKPQKQAALAAQNSEAFQQSQITGGTICSVDIGATTTKAAVIQNGKIVDCAVLAMGSDALRLDQSGKVLGINEEGETFLDAVAKKIFVGSTIDTETQENLAALMAETIAHFLHRKRPPQVTQRLLQTEPLTQDYNIDEYWLSGGVAQAMSFLEIGYPLAFEDMGILLAKHLITSFQERDMQFRVAQEPAIRIAFAALKMALSL